MPARDQGRPRSARDPGTAASRVDMLFRERAFWMYFTAHRLGDMRRLVRQYSPRLETVSLRALLKGGRYGLRSRARAGPGGAQQPKLGRARGARIRKRVCKDLNA